MNIPNNKLSMEDKSLESILTETLFKDVVDFTLLTESLQFVENALMAFANSPDFLAHMNKAFGQDIESSRFQALWAAADFRQLPPILVRPSQEINGANGAYAASINTMYLSQEFLSLNRNHPEAIATVLLEEIGHFVDTQLNTQDSSGDEGAIFSALVQGNMLTPQKLSILKLEDDTATIMLDGQALKIEQSTFLVTEGNDTITGTTGDDTIDSLGGNDTIHGLGGNDLLIGGLGNDTLYGEVGNDTLDGGDGNDYLVPGTGVNIVIGGSGSDRLDLDYSNLTTGLTVNYSNANAGTISDG